METDMRTGRVALASLIILLAATEAAALNLKVREVRRGPNGGTVTLTYEVENASVDAVRLGRAELHLTDSSGRRLDILPLPAPTHPLERGEAAFLSARTQESRLREAARLTLRLYPLPPFPFPVGEVRVPPVEARFDGPAAPRGRSPAASPERATPPRSARWRLRLAGTVTAATRDSVLLLYALAGPGGPPESPAILEVRYSGGGALLEARSLPVPPARDSQAYLEVTLSLPLARIVDGIEARIFVVGGEGIAVHPVTVEGHRQGDGVRTGTGSPVPAPHVPKPVLDPARPF